MYRITPPTLYVGPINRIDAKLPLGYRIEYDVQNEWDDNTWRVFVLALYSCYYYYLNVLTIYFPEWVDARKVYCTVDAFIFFFEPRLLL